MKVRNGETRVSRGLLPSRRRCQTHRSRILTEAGDIRLQVQTAVEDLNTVKVQLRSFIAAYGAVRNALHHTIMTSGRSRNIYEDTRVPLFLFSR